MNKKDYQTLVDKIDTLSKKIEEMERILTILNYKIDQPQQPTLLLPEVICNGGMACGD
jgi:hypothetical protein